MWVVTHVLAGLAIAALLGGPWWLVLIVVVLAHILMDLVPHWDYTISRHPDAGMYCDLAASLAAWLLAWLALDMPFCMALMGPISGGPDLDVLVAMIRGGRAAKYFPSHVDGFPHGKSGPAWGIGVQVAIWTACIAVILALRPL